MSLASVSMRAIGCRARARRGQRAGRVAGVDAGLLDLFHDAGDDGERRSAALAVRLHCVSSSLCLFVSLRGEVCHHIHIDLDRAGEELVDEDGGVVEAGLLQGGADEGAEGRLVLADFHAAAAEDVRGADEDGVADAGGLADGFVEGARDAGGGALEVQVVEDFVEAVAVLGAVDGIDGGADDGSAGGEEALGEVERRLAAELDDDAVDEPASTFG